MNPESITHSTSNKRGPETIATRLSDSEMRAVDAAVQAAGTNRARWLRTAVLSHLGQPDPTCSPSLDSTILQETMGVRYLVLNLFARTSPELSLETLHDVMGIADRGKQAAAARTLAGLVNPTP